MTSQKGFALIEIVVVLGVMMSILAMGLVMDLNFVKGDNFLSEESVIVSLLQRARSEAMNNMFQSTHGFCYASPNYIVFKERATCLPKSGEDLLIPANPNIGENASTTFPGEIVFSQLAGTTSPATIHITDGIKSADIKINYEGTITW